MREDYIFLSSSAAVFLHTFGGDGESHPGGLSDSRQQTFGNREGQREEEDGHADHAEADEGAP